LIHFGPVEEVNRGSETIEVRADAERLNELLQNFGGTSTLARENGYYNVTLRENFHGKDLNRYLFENGVVADHLVTKKKSLEKMFLEILAEGN
jgi:ABC-2 type transport system ATP-binding protein